MGGRLKLPILVEVGYCRDVGQRDWGGHLDMWCA